MSSKKKIACVGAGFTGAVIAHILAKNGDLHIDVFDERDHVAGNCHTRRDPDTDVMLHVYGPHIFHTSNKTVWEFVNQFSKFESYRHKVKATTTEGVFSLPVNLLTINQLFSQKLSPAEAKEFIASQVSGNAAPKNFEEQAISMLGEKIYATFFRDYTRKQWGLDPRELPASIFKRLPVRFDYNDEYFNDPYQGIPVDGYTTLIEKLLDHPNIHIFLKQSVGRDVLREYDHIFYSGTIDGWFGHKFGELPYRTLDFEVFRYQGDFQGTSVMNYCDPGTLPTRITEFKHFTPWESHTGSICYREFSRAANRSDIPYYPVRMTTDKLLLDRYIEEARQETLPVTFSGRLGTYRYLDMHVCIAESMDLARQYLAAADFSTTRFGVNPN